MAPKPVLAREKRFVVLVYGKEAARQLAAELAAHLDAGKNHGRHVHSPFMAGASAHERNRARRLGIRLYRALGSAIVAVVQEAGHAQ
jgi:hypothetical protein